MGIERTAIVFPHQLFENSPLINKCGVFYLVEENLFFKQFQFHKQKIAYHRATMKWYASYLSGKNKKVVYIDAHDENSDIRKLIPYCKNLGVESMDYIDPTDDWLHGRIISAGKKVGLQLTQHPQQLFINSKDEITTYFHGKTRFFQADFYAWQRSSRQILMETDKKPLGGKWSYDAENRLRYLKSRQPPAINFQSKNHYYAEAVSYADTSFPDNYGNLSNGYRYPSTHGESKAWFRQFLAKRFAEFGPYEDSIVADQHILHHSVLTPMLNTGLLSPGDVVNETLEYASNNEIPINSLEGFLRQVIGWREYMRAVYEIKGIEERTRNFWGFSRKIPSSFWEGTTGIAPVDNTIRKVLDTGYCHHIERLMVLGNFMLLCEFHPDEVYKWFMEMFIDAYDWVMVPNVYGMSQFSDGGLMSTKPYISGSNYILKMSDYKKGDWQMIWDALFWRFMHVHRKFFLSNPRLGLLIGTFDKMPDEKKKFHLTTAEKYLASMH
ncbi:cryptochrome/photolyase family protein [Flavitalea antarctica]